MIQFTKNREKFSGGRGENILEGEINFYTIFSISLSYMEKVREPGSQAPSGQTTFKQSKHLTVARRSVAGSYIKRFLFINT